MSIPAPHMMRTAATLSLLLIAAALLGGCDSPRQTQVTTEEQISKETTGSLTPLERGAVRRDAYRVARAGLDAFLADDAEGIRSNFATEYVTYWEKTRTQNAAEGRKRVRKHQLESFDVSDMNETGTQAIIEYYFIDQSYYEDLKGNAITKPNTGEAAEEMFQFTVVKTDDGWIITRMIGDEPVLK